jgi:hypothetical protein
MGNGQSLPWHEYAGNSQGEGNNKKALSGAQFMMIGGGLGLLASVIALCIINFSGDFGPNTRASMNPIWWIVALLCAALVGFALWLHFRRPQDSDDYPDLLGQIFPHAHLMEADGVHLAAFAFQHGPYCRIVVVAQNLFDQPSDLQLDFTGHVNAPLQLKLPAGGVAMAWIDDSLGDNGGHFKTTFRALSSTAGNRIRMRKRNLLGRNSMQTAILLIKSPGFMLTRDTTTPRGNPPMHVIFADLAGKLPLQLAPAGSIPTAQVPKLSHNWQAAILWDSQKKREPDEVAAQLSKLFGNVPLKYQFPFRFGITAGAPDALHPG